MGILKLEVKDVLCLQGNPMEEGYDVTLHKEEKHEEVMKKAREVGMARPMCHYEVTSLAKNNFRVVTVNMYNPHVTDEEVRAFLGRYMDNVSSARLLKDSLGFWNGRRGFQALLREDPKGLGGYLHPPAMFSLGADRGTLFYARQPPFCRRCMAYGHTLASCGTRKCRFCGSGEHEAKDCDVLKACHGCGSSEHLWRDCPSRRQSYADAAAGRREGGDPVEERQRRGDPGPRVEVPEKNERERPCPPEPTPRARARKELASGTSVKGGEEDGGRTEELGSSLDGVEGLGALVEMVENLPGVGSIAGEWVAASIIQLSPGQGGEEQPGTGGVPGLEPDPYEGKKRR
uniref:CCHC-type domain-containing protein n=1 Tax=Hucho hucho TaxID=62062 RepID=A0A4W5KCU1_9TELE